VGTWAGAALAAGQLAAWWAALAVLEYFTRPRPPAEADRTPQERAEDGERTVRV
jgi:hypothetical protein